MLDSLKRALACSFLAVVCGSLAGPVAAADRAVISSPADWSTTLTWSGGAVPGVSDNAFVGSTTPAGALTSATVSLSQNVTAGNVYLGRNAATSGTLELGNFTFTANQFFFGFVGSGSITRGTGFLDVNRFDIRNGSFTLAAADIVRHGIEASNGSSLTLGANLILSDRLDIRGTGTVLNADGKNIRATNEILLGWNGSGAALTNRGTITTNQLSVRGQDFQLAAADSINTFIMRAGNTNLGGGVTISVLDLRENALATSTEIGNITGAVSVESGAKLTLGANLNVSEQINIRGVGSTLDAAGKEIRANNDFLIGWDGVGAALTNRGKITTGRLAVRGQDFHLTANDAVSWFIMRAGTTNLGSGVIISRLDLLENAVATTAATGNITAYVSVENGSSLTLGANLTLSDKLNIFGTGTTVNAAGKDITAASQLLHGWDGFTKPTLLNVGKIAVGELLMGNAAELALASGQDTTGRIWLRQDAHLTSTVSAAGSGLTLTRTPTNELIIEAGSRLTLASGPVDGWAFRWANPTAGDHIADINTLIAQGRIDFSFQGGGYTITSNPDGYTYVLVPVPEPAFVLTLCAVALGLAGAATRRRLRAVQHA